MIEKLNIKQKTIIIIAILLLIIGITIYFIVINKEQKQYNINEFLDLSNSENENTNEKQIIVYITGEVNSPGVVKLPEKARIADAIEIVGGVTKEADLDEVNLAFVLSDGQKIYIPNKKEASSEKMYITNESGNNVIVQDKVGEAKNQKVNINEATQADLEELPGIGPSIADKIIEYRDKNGKFTSIEELQEVNGIGEKKFQYIEEYITVK